MALKIVFFSVYSLFTIEICRANLPPVITTDLSSVLVKEDVPVGTKVLSLEAEDPEGGDLRFGLQGSPLLRIDPVSGVITTTTSLDREDKDTVRVVAIVEDRVEGGDNNVVRLPLEVVILDVNDNGPVFSTKSYSASVSEDAPLGSTVIADISLSDVDQVGDILSLACLDDDKLTETFAIVPQGKSTRAYRGSLILNSSVPYGERNLFELTLVASDGLNVVTAPLRISVRDVQNSPPKFFGSATGIVSEDAPIGTLVMKLKAEDQDVGDPRDVVYELVENPLGFFLLDPDNGELRTAKPLDREAIPDQTGVVSLIVKALETVSGSRAAAGSDSETVQPIRITIQDVNDEAPIFSKQEYRVSVPENLPIDTPVSDLDMTVTDPDMGSNSVFDLRLVDPSGWFSLSPQNATGSTSVSLRLARGNIDYENPNGRKFILLVVAQESMTPERLSSTATVVVSVTDTNDNRPSFPQEAYTAMVSEGASGGSVVATIAASDPDLGRFGSNGVIYALRGNGAEKFGVDRVSGVITVAPCETPGRGRCLDYEQKQTYFLSLEAADEDGRGLRTVVPLRISLRDANDNPPRFPQSVYRAVIREGSREFDPPLIVNAIDPDVSSRLQYSLVGGGERGLFRIDPDSGKIRVVDPNGLNISELRQTEFVLTVEAKDGLGSHSSKVHIAVRDVNNNKPIFQKNVYTASVQENSPLGTLVDMVSATDLDTGINAQISYRIIKGAFHHFAVNETSGEVFVAAKLNYDERSSYEIGIAAQDKGVPPLSSFTVLHVTVIDNNDKNPYFTPTTQRIQVKEDHTEGSPIYTLVAEDQDVSPEIGLYMALENVHSAIDDQGMALNRDQLNRIKDTFTVEPTGQVVLKKLLNRNLTAEITLRVSVSDVSANPQQTSEGFLVITVVDVNDNAPTFPAPWSLSRPYLSVVVPEELSEGSVVTTIIASDVDSNIASYEIIPPSEHLDIDQSSGVVTVKGRLDYEAIESVNATVVVKDTGAPQLSATATLIVKLTNINDEEPVFSDRSYEASVEEHSPPGTFVLQVTAQDRDKDRLGLLKYSLAGDHSDYFRIDQTGKISVSGTRPLDREKTPTMRIRAVASDNGPRDNQKQTSVPIYVKIMDINDHVPHFDQKVFTSSVVEGLPLDPPVPVLQVKATDEDEGINAALAYRVIAGSGMDLFRINASTGILYPAKVLRAGEESKSFELTVEVRDLDGEGSKNDLAKVVVSVLPRNEHKPIFLVPPPTRGYTVSIPEESPDEVVEVLTVRASDADAGKNGQVRYHFRVNENNVQETPTFHIDPITGRIDTKHRLDREKEHKYELVLVAKDSGSPISFETLRVLTVEVADLDDHGPSFAHQDQLDSSYRFSVTENRPRGALVGKVTARDQDTSPNARIFYHIVAGNENGSLRIDKSNGNLFTSRVLDREEIPSYNLWIKATDSPRYPSVDVQSLSSTSRHDDPSFTRVTITVLDENDNPPKFSENIFYAGVPFEAEIGHLLQKISAIDADAGVNSSLTYSILSSTFFRPGDSKPVGSIVPSPFNMTKEGQLLTSTPMYPYKKHRFLLEVQAKENAPPYRSDTCSIYVWVWEIEDLLKVILEQPPNEVLKNRQHITSRLSGILNGQAVIDEVRYFTHPNNSISRKWTEMLMHVVNKTSHVVPAIEVIKTMDRGFLQLEESESTSKIRSIYPISNGEESKSFDMRFAGLIALAVALCIGFVSFIVVCCCLRVWVIGSAKSKEQLIHKISADEDPGLNTTENPLWMDQKLKSYEEQELSMHVMSEFDPSGVVNHPMIMKEPSVSHMNMETQSNTYATIQKSHGGTIRSLQLRNLQHRPIAIDFKDDSRFNSDYATLEYIRRSSGPANSVKGPTVPGVETPHNPVLLRNGKRPSSEEIVTRFTELGAGSKEAPNMLNRPLPEEPSSSRIHPGSQRNRRFSKNSLGEPCIVAELI